jgi:tRNA nucleotidyltransferase/poly(A) polymerase
MKPIKLHAPMKHLPQGVYDIYDAFKDADKKLYVVGGAVRDHLKGKNPKDYDLATDARPDEVIQILDKHNIPRTEQVGEQFGVVIAKPDEEYEIATFRKDLEAGRDTKVQFTSMEEDAARRDLTINALYYDIETGEVIDYVGGIDDIQNERVRTVGAAEDRFSEDPLRVLRFIRFHARVNPGGIESMDESGLEAIRKFADSGLKDQKGRSVAPERVRDEFIKGIKSAISPQSYLEIYNDTGLLKDYVFPGLKIDLNFPEATNNYVLAIAQMLRHNDPSTVARKLNDLKYSRVEAGEIVYLLRLLKLKEGDPEHVYGLKKNQPEMPGNEWEQWKKWHNLGPVEKLRQYKLSRREDVPGAMDIQGPEIGKLMRKYDADRILDMGFREWLSFS